MCCAISDFNQVLPCASGKVNAQHLEGIFETPQGAVENMHYECFGVASVFESTLNVILHYDLDRDPREHRGVLVAISSQPGPGVTKDKIRFWWPVILIGTLSRLQPDR